MPNKDNLEQYYLDFLGKFSTLALATVNSKGDVDCATVYYAFNSEGEVFFVADSKTSKSINLRDTKKFAAAIDDGGSSSKGIKIRGVVEEISDETTIMVAQELLVARVPAIKAFFDNPDLVIYKLAPKQRFIINFAWGIDWRLEVL